jgi:hypothetical protein
MTDFVLPIPLPWFVCQRPIFLVDRHLEMSDKDQFYGISLFSESFLCQYVEPECPMKYYEQSP